MPQLKIYIVEDNELMASALKKILLGLGHSICGIADNYRQAINELHCLDVDLVITDIMLRGTENGIDLGRYINDNLHIPFIYQSSISSNDMIKAANSNMPDAYLFKPVTKDSIAGAIQASIKKSA